MSKIDEVRLLFSLEKVCGRISPERCNQHCTSHVFKCAALHHRCTVGPQKQSLDFQNAITCRPASEAPSGALTPSGCCSPTMCGHPPTACLQRSSAADLVEYLLCPGSLLLRC